jgi:hypothetical protein
MRGPDIFNVEQPAGNPLGRLSMPVGMSAPMLEAAHGVMADPFA